MAIRIQLRNDTAANWTSVNPTLAQGEMGVETDTRKFKIGDGSTAWTSLAYGLLTGSLSSASVTTASTDKSANYTLTSADKNTFIRSTGSAITITVPDVLSNGESVNFIQAGTGQITFTGSGITLYSADSKVLTAKQYAAATITKSGGSYYLIGNLG
jgi:hypothetical protein